MRLCSLQSTFSTSMLCKERSRLHLLLCPAQSSNTSMHTLHRKCCTRISFGSIVCLLCVYAVCNQHSVQACFAKNEADFISCYVLPSPSTLACTHSIENAAHVSVQEAEASHVLIMCLCSLPPTFSTSMLCKERNTPA